MKKLNDAQITAKSVEISKSLLNTTAGLIDYDLSDTRTVGDAARLAVTIKHLRDKMMRETIAGVSSALKIDFRVTEAKILPSFEEFGWVDLRRSGNRIVSLTESIPPPEDILATLGKFWREQEPTTIDEATVLSLSELSKRPFSKDALISELGIKDQEFRNMFDYGEQARYFGKFQSRTQGVETIWTPLYWAGKTDKVLKFIQKSDDERFSKIGSLAGRFKRHPGTPTERLGSKDTSLTNAGIYHGFFPAVEIRNRQGKAYEYAFAATPQFEVDPSKDIYEKARLIVSCIRHGQYHAEITKILYPRNILQAMRNNRMKPHSYAVIQYAILVLHGIVKLEPASMRYGKAFKVLWIDTPENNLAADMADQLLRGGETLPSSREELEARKILVQGMYNYSSEQRRLKIGRTIIAKSEFDRMMELMSGVRQ